MLIFAGSVSLLTFGIVGLLMLAAAIFICVAVDWLICTGARLVRRSRVVDLTPVFPIAMARARRKRQRRL